MRPLVLSRQITIKEMSMSKISVNLQHAIDVLTSSGDNTFEFIEKLNISIDDCCKLETPAKQKGCARVLQKELESILEQYDFLFSPDEKVRLNKMRTRLKFLKF